MILILILCATVIFSAIFTNHFLKSLGVPTLLFFMCLGILFGSDGLFKIEYQNFHLTKEICSVALGFVIFYGGFCTKWKTAKTVIWKASVLSTLGVCLTALIVCVLCRYLLDIPYLESFLIGSVIASTDAASVFSILKSRHMNLKENSAPLLEVESGSNDPMSYILVVIAMSLFANEGIGSSIILFFKQIIFGCLVGIILAQLSIFIFTKTKVITEGNDVLFVIAVVLAALVITELIHGNPFLSVYILGIILGNFKIKNKFTLLNFFDGITKLAQMGIFFMLGLLSFPSKIPQIFSTGVYIFLILTFIARPVTVFMLLIPFKASLRQCLLVSWAGLRGVASIVFVIIAMNHDKINLDYDLFHIVFLISLLSVSFQGTLLPFIARKVNMVQDFSVGFKTFNDYQDEYALRLMKINVEEGSGWVNKKIKDISFPEGSLVLLILRKDTKVIPKGDVLIKPQDVLLLSLPTTAVVEDIDLKEVVVDKKHRWFGKKIKDLNLEKQDFIMLIKRDSEYIVPKGDVVLQNEDLVVMCHN